MRQKLHQYLGLVDMAETKSGEKKTTTEDLQVSNPKLFFVCAKGVCSCICISIIISPKFHFSHPTAYRDFGTWCTSK